MCNEGWYVRSGGDCVKLRGTVWNTLKWSGTKTRGGETKILRGGQAGSVRGCNEKGRDCRGWNPLRNYDVRFVIS